MSDLVNLVIDENDGWTKLDILDGGSLTLPVGGMFCVSDSTPETSFVGHSIKRKPINFSLESGKSVWIKSNRRCTAVYFGIITDVESETDWTEQLIWS